MATDYTPPDQDRASSILQRLMSWSIRLLTTLMILVLPIMMTMIAAFTK